MISLQEHARLGNFRLGGEPPRPPSRLLLEFVIHLWYQPNYNFVMHMRKSKLISVRVPEDILEKLDKMLNRERYYNRSAVICALLDVATSTLQQKQLERLCNFCSYYGHRVSALHLVLRIYGREEVVHFVDESQKSADD